MFLIDSISITYKLQPNLVLEDLSQNLWQIWTCIKVSNWLNIYYLQIAAKFSAIDLSQNLWQIWACIKISNWLNSYYLHVAAKFSARRFVTKFMANIRFFWWQYTWFSNMENDSAALHRLIIVLLIWMSIQV